MDAAHIRALRAQLALHQRSLRHLETQIAGYAGIAPVHLLNQADDTQRAIARVAAALTALGDDPTTVSAADLPPVDAEDGQRAADPVADAQTVLRSMPLDHLPPPTTILPPASRMPFARNPQFVGRERELMALALAIADPAPTVMVSAVAAGLGGLGKTSLAIEFVYRYARYFAGGVFWLTCADPATIPSEVAACASALDLAVDGKPLDDQVAAVRRAWEDAIPRLVVFDNCEDPQVLDQWRPPHGGSRVLVTARRSTWPRDLYRVALGLLDRADSMALLQRLCPRLVSDEADGLAEDLGDLPLALHLAGSYLNTYDHVSVAAYRAQFSLDHDSLKGRGTESLPTHHERDVARTFALSYDQLDPQSPIDALARWLLAYAACLAPGVPIPRDLLLAMVSAGTVLEDAIDALARLRSLGLLDGDVPVLHRLLAGFVQRQTDLPAVQDAVERAVNAQAFRINAPAEASFIPLHLRHLADQALMQDATLGAVHPDIAQSLNALAWRLHMLNDYGRARALLERVHAIYEVVLGPGHLVVARNLRDIGLMFKVRFDSIRARPFYVQAQAILDAALGPEHPNAVRNLKDLAELSCDMFNYDEARLLFGRVLAIREAALGPLHPDTAESLEDLARVLSAMEDYDEARALFERALLIREMEPMGFSTVQCLENLAEVLYRIGNDVEARVLRERARTYLEQLGGEDD